LRHIDAELPGDFQIQDQLELRRLLDGQFTGLRTLEDFINLMSETTKSVAHIGPIGDQAAGVYKLREAVDGRQLLLVREPDDRSFNAKGNLVLVDKHRVSAGAGDGCQCRIDLRGGLKRDTDERDT
jgi:hypothetical protein